MKNHIKKIIIASLITTLTFGVIGCSKKDETTNNDKASQQSVEKFNEVKYTYKDENGDHKVTIKSPKQKAVTLSQFMTEMLLALGLEDRMVGTALLDNPILPEYEEAYKKVPVLEITEGHSISKESFIATGVDFVSGWDGSINENSTGSAEELISKDIAPFLASSYMVDATVETVYDDFKLLGQIFDVNDKADEVIADMKNKIEEVSKKIKHIDDNERKRVLVYDSGENSAMVVGCGLADDIITRAGGKNVFGDDADQPYIMASWESIVAANPEVIIVTDYMAGSPVDEKINFLKSHPALQNVDAIKNNKIFSAGLADFSPGVRNAKLIERIYEFLYEDVK